MIPFSPFGEFFSWNCRKITLIASDVSGPTMEASGLRE
jgi:hypothetical protein